MKSTDTAKSPSQRTDKTPELDLRYGKIGISAVAAALRYQSDSRNPAYAPVAHRQDDRLTEHFGDKAA